MEVEALNADPTPIEDLTVPAVMEHLEAVVSKIEPAPILMGHSAGRVFTQILMDRGYGAAGVAPGRGLGAGLMADRMVVERLQELCGFRVVPGTLNVRLPGPLERGPSWRYMPAVEITPDWEARTGQAGYFLAPVTVAGRYRGLAFQAVEPGERGYPPDQIELFCEAHLRTELGLDDGDIIAVWLNDE